MVRYNEFVLPESLENVSKDELLNAFLKNGLFLWRTSVLYEKKMDVILRREINQEDDNTKTWYRFWLRTEACIADSYKMYYLKSMIDKVFEIFSTLTNRAIMGYILSFNDALCAKNNFSVFQTIEENVRYFRDESTPKSLVFLFLYRDELYESIKTHVPKTLLARGILEKIFGTYYVKCIKNIDYAEIIREFIYREVSGDAFRLEDVANVVAFFLKTSASKQVKEISNAIYSDMEKVYKTKVLKQKEVTGDGKKER